MKEIPLTQGQIALVDDSDFEWLNQRKWCAVKMKNTFYAVSRIPGSRKMVYMHRAILNSPKGSFTNHENGIGTDNQRSNIRPCTNAQNRQSFMTRAAGRSSRFRGVYWNTAKRLWRAQIYVKGKQIFLGYFKLETEAALAYNDAAQEHFGEFAQLNKVS